MTRLNWNMDGEKRFEAGLDRGVLYPPNEPGVPWNGLFSVEEISDHRTPRPYYIDGRKFNEEQGLGEFEARLEAYTYPREFMSFQGEGVLETGISVDNQRRGRFNLSYRTRIGNDIEGIDHGYKIHFVYNCLATPESFNNETIGDTLAPTRKSWNLSTISEDIDGFAPTAHLTVSSINTDPYVLAELENYLYGTDTRDPELPTPNELITILEEWAELIIFDHGNGLYTAQSSTDAITMTGLEIGQDEDGEPIFDEGSINYVFQISSDHGATWIDDNLYTLTSR